MGQNTGREASDGEEGRHVEQRKEKENKPKNAYDVILSCKPSDLCRDGHWKVKLPAGDSVLKRKTQTNAVAIGILGNVNSGKTWVMSRLCQCDLPDQGLTMRTDGFSLKWIDLCDGLDQSTVAYVVMDSAGINRPIDLLKGMTDGDETPELENLGELYREERLAKSSKKKKFSCEFLTEKAQESARYEDFLQTMTLQLSNCVIVVMNETTYLDQIFLHKFVQKWLTLCKINSFLRRDDDVYVIHNFLRTTDPKERDHLFKNSTVKLYPGQLKEGSVLHFRCTHENFRTHHVCLMCDDDETGKAYNNRVFALLKHWMQIRVNQCEKGGLGPLVERFSSCAHTVLTRGYVQNLKEIIPKTVDNMLRLQAVKENDDYPLKAVTTMEDRIYGAMKGFVPPAKLLTYTSKSGKRCKLIYLEMPGVKKDSIRIENVYKYSNPGSSAVQVKATKEKIDPMAYLAELSELLSLEEHAGIYPREKKPDFEEEADSCQYGEICKTFQIPLDFDTNGTIMWGEDGAVYIIFRERQP